MRVLPIALLVLVPACGADAPHEAEEVPASPLAIDRVELRSCRSEADCADGLACVASRCVACAHHADCSSDVCDVYGRTPRGFGRCVPRCEVVYIDQHDASCATGDGSKSAPVCTIRDGVARTDDQKRSVRVYPGNYLPFRVVGRAIAVYGPAGEGGVAEVTEEDVGGVSVTDGARVVVDGFVLGRNSTYGLLCRNSSVDVRRSTLLADVGVGLRVTSCHARLDRDRLSGSSGAMTLDGSSYEITNVVVSGVSARTAIVVRDSHGRFLFNTVVRNDEEEGRAAGAIDCGATPVLLEDSIVVGNRLSDPGGSQFAGACRFRQVVVGTRDTTLEPGAIHEDPDLDDYRLPRDAANTSCCIDRGPRRSFVRTDFDGTSRPQGPRFDIGAFEAKE